MKNDPPVIEKRTTRTIAGLRLDISRVSGGRGGDWCRASARWFVNIMHPDHFSGNDSTPTYTGCMGGGATMAEAAHKAAELARAHWNQGASL